MNFATANVNGLIVVNAHTVINMITYGMTKEARGRASTLLAIAKDLEKQQSKDRVWVVMSPTFRVYAPRGMTKEEIAMKYKPKRIVLNID